MGLSLGGLGWGENLRRLLVVCPRIVSWLKQMLRVGAEIARSGHRINFILIWMVCSEIDLGTITKVMAKSDDSYIFTGRKLNTASGLPVNLDLHSI